VAVAVAGAVLVARSALEPATTHGSAPAAQPLGVAGVVPGACVAYPASGSPAGKTVYLDPGHGGVDPGAVAFRADGRRVLEKDVTLAVATRLAAMLERDGYRVAMSRTADTSVAELSANDLVAGALTADAERHDLLKRAACANASGASLLVSIHFNAVADPSVGGTQAFYDAARPFAAANRELAAGLQSALVGALDSTDRGVWSDGALTAPALTPRGEAYGHFVELGPALPGWVDEPSAMPGAVVEPLFLTNANDLVYATSGAGQERIALGLKIGIEKLPGG
jgi:N-acetylmuramoyl-L-alanine amidase